MKARLAKMIGLPGRSASVTSIGIRVRRTASTNTPPCSRTFSMWRSDEVRASVPTRLSWKAFMPKPGVMRNCPVVDITGAQRVHRSGHATPHRTTTCILIGHEGDRLHRRLRQGKEEAVALLRDLEQPDRDDEAVLSGVKNPPAATIA